MIQNSAIQKVLSYFIMEVQWSGKAWFFCELFKLSFQYNFRRFNQVKISRFNFNHFRTFAREDGGCVNQKKLQIRQAFFWIFCDGWWKSKGWVGWVSWFWKSNGHFHKKLKNNMPKYLKATYFSIGRGMKLLGQGIWNSSYDKDGNFCYMCS